MLIDKAAIAKMIPHAGPMCLLDGVLHWDAQTIRCMSRNRRAATHPLRVDGRLPALAGIEYAAQAMAVHGALLAPPDSASARIGYLVSVRGTQLYVSRLDDIAANLQIKARCITRSENNILYQFSVSAAGILLLEGRAAVVLNAQALKSSSGDTV